MPDEPVLPPLREPDRPAVLFDAALLEAFYLAHVDLVRNQQFVMPRQPAIQRPETWRVMMKRYDADSLIAEEIKNVVAVNRWCIKHLGGIAVAASGVEKLIKETYAAHEDTIKRWGGWRFIGDPVMIDDTAQGEQIMSEILRDLALTNRGKEVTKIARDKGFALDTRHIGQMMTADGTYHNVLTRKTVPDQFGRKAHVTKGADLHAQAIYAECISYGVSGNDIAFTDAVTKAIHAPIRVGERGGAALLDHLKRHLSKEFPEYIEYVARLIQICGEQLWAMQKTPVIAVISVAPSNFLMIGNMKYDAESCFRTRRGTNAGNKHRLSANLKDSFSLWFFRNKKHPTADIKRNRYGMPASIYNVARGWGFSLMPHGVCASNFYGLLRSDLRPVYTKVLSEAYNIDIEKQVLGVQCSKLDIWYHDVCRALNPIIYFNNDSDFIIAKGGNPKQFPKQLAAQLLPIR